MALKVENDEIDLHENSLDNSADSELLGMVDEASFGGSEQHFLDVKEDDSGYNFRDLSGVSYKLIPCDMAQDHDNIVHTTTTVPAVPEFYVVAEQQFGVPTVQKQKVLRKAPVVAKPVIAKKRDDKRRATHNEVERRRRDKINTWITKLAALVPNSGLPDASSKGCILAKACDYITELTEKHKRLEKLEVDNEKLVLEILRLNSELTELRKENSAIRSELADICIVGSQRPKGQKS